MSKSNHRKSAPRKMKQVIKQEVSKPVMSREESINLFMSNKLTQEEITITDALTGKRSGDLNPKYKDITKQVLCALAAISAFVAFVILIKE